MPCRVELGHSNVCFGVEKSWPKRIFGKTDLKLLNEKEKTKMYAHMERKATKLYEKYVDKERLEKRRERRSIRALAPYYEEIYRRNLFKRIKALGETTTETHEYIDVDSEDSDIDISLQTVINTGSLAGTAQAHKSKRQKDVIDVNDNDVLVIRSDEGEDTDDDDDRYCDANSESAIESTTNNTPSERESDRELDCATPHMNTNEFDMRTPSIDRFRHQDLVEEDFEDSDIDDEPHSEIDSLEFMSQTIEAVTSTQQ